MTQVGTVGPGAGDDVGFAVGPGVGDDVGFAVGPGVGDGVGFAVGFSVGLGVGRKSSLTIRSMHLSAIAAIVYDGLAAPVEPLISAPSTT